MAYDKQKAAQLYNYYVEQGFPAHVAAGAVGNVVQESGLNPRAFNEAEGAFGAFQHRNERLDGLRAFATERQAAHDDLMTQAAFSLRELETTHKGAKAMLLETQTPAQAAEVWDKKFEISSGAHVAQRQKYADEIYQMMTGNAPPQVEALSFGPNTPAMPTDVSQMGPQDIKAPMTQGRFDFEMPDYQERLMHLGQNRSPLDQIVLAMGMPEGRAAVADAVVNNDVADRALSAALGLDAEGIGPGLPFDMGKSSPNEGNSAPSRSAPVGPPAAPGTPAALATSTDPKDQEEAEKKKKDARRQRIADVLEVLGVGLSNLSVGKGADASSALQGQRQRRLGEAAQEQDAEKMAMQQYENDRQYGLQQQQLALQQQQFAYEQQKNQPVNPDGLAKMLLASGNPQAAALAYMGDDGYSAAMDIAKQAYTPKAPKDGGISQEEQQALVGYFNEAGDAEMAAFAGLGPEAAQEAIRMFGKGSGEAGDSIAPEDRMFVAQGLRDLGMPQAAEIARTTTNPAVFEHVAKKVADREAAKVGKTDDTEAPLSPEVRELYANYFDEVSPTTAAAIRAGVPDSFLLEQAAKDEDLRRAVSQANQINMNELKAGTEQDQAAGAKMAEALTAANVPAEQARLFADMGMVNGTKALTIVQDTAAKSQERTDARRIGDAFANMFPDDPALQEAYRTARNSTDLANANEAAKLKMPTITNDVRNFEYAKQHPEFGPWLARSRLSTAGQVPAQEKVMMDQFITLVDAQAEQSIKDRQLTEVMRMASTVITQPGFESGMWQSVLYPVQNALRSALGDAAPDLLSDTDAVGLRLIESLSSGNIGAFRPEGSGAMSDFDAQQILRSLPQITDTTVQAAAVTQLYLAMADARQRNYNYTMDYLKEYGGTEDFSTGQHYNDYMNKRAKAEGAPQTPFQKFDSFDSLEKAVDTGTLQPGDVFMIVDENGNTQYEIAQ